MQSPGKYLFTLFIPSIAIVLVRSIAEPVLPLFLENAGYSFALIGTILSASPMGTLLSALPSGALLSRYSIRQVTLSGASITAVSVLAIYFTDQISLIFVCWLLSGVGLGLFEMGRLQYTSQFIANQERGRVVSVLGGIVRFGRIIGPLIGGWLIQQVNFQIPFLVMALFAGVATGLIWLLFPDTEPEHIDRSISYSEELTGVIRDHWKIFSIAGSGQLLLQCIRTGRASLIPLFGSAVLGLTPQEISYVLSIGAAVDTSLFTLAGQIMDRFGRKSAIIPSALIQAVGFVIIPFTGGFTGLLVGSIIIGLGNGISAGTMMTLGGDLAPVGHRAPFLSVWRTFSSAGFVVGPNVVGVISQLFALGPASWAIAGIGGLAAFIFWRFVPETLQQKETV